MLLVVKVGGSIIGKGVSPTILSDIKEVAKENELILVHGGGDEVTEVAEKLGKKQSFVVSPEGIRSRYTDKETATIYTMVMVGKVNKEVTAVLQKEGISAIGLSGVDGGLIRADRKKKLIIVDERGRRRMIDGGYTGKISQVDSELLYLLLNKGYIPVIAPVALSEEFEFLNVDGDRAAAYVGGAVKADVVMFLTDVKGVLVGDRTLPNINVKEAKELLPKIGFGMEKKVLASIEAVSMGVKRCIIASGLVERPISSALAEKECTVIS